MRKGSEGKSPSSSPRLDCDVGLGLKMPADSYYCDGGGHNLYDGLFAQRSFLNTGGGMGVCGKGVFTSSQWEELERQKMIHKYILASIPVPPQLLLPRSPPPSLSQCNSSLELRFSSSSSGGGGSGSDREPWRCKRTDGKKWRCSRDVAPDLKYCERHAHKSRPRSRKLVEVSPHKPIIPHPTPLPLTLPLPPPTSSYDQTRCIEWFMKGGSSDTNSVSISTHKQWGEHVMHLSSSSTMEEEEKEKEKEEDDNNKNLHPFNHDFMTPNPYIPDTSNLHNQILDPKTRHFIDAWEKEGYQTKGLSTTNFPISPSSSLSLSMCGGDYDSAKGNSGIRMMTSDREIMKPQWMMNSVSWTNSPPGGPLGEALCLGNPTTTRGTYGYSNTNTNSNTNSSICSKSSCEDGSSYALNFIGDS